MLTTRVPGLSGLAAMTLADLDAICDVLNTQPRRSLGWKSPNEVYADHAAR